MKKLLLATALAATMMFMAQNAMAGAWCEGVLKDGPDVDTDPDPGSGACSAAVPNPGATTGCEGLENAGDIGFGTGCFAAADGGGACIGGTVGAGGAVGCLCVQDVCACSTGAPLTPAVPCDEATCRAAAEAGCS